MRIVIEIEDSHREIARKMKRFWAGMARLDAQLAACRALLRAL